MPLDLRRLEHEHWRSELYCRLINEISKHLAIGVGWFILVDLESPGFRKFLYLTYVAT